MKRLSHALAGCVLTAALLAGCLAEAPSASQPSSSPSAAFSPSPPAKYVSRIGNCLRLSGANDEADYDRDPVVSCDGNFGALVIGVGTFGPQGATIDAMNAAYVECDTMVRSFLNEDWRNGRLKIKIERPTSATEPTGERWWECTLQGDDGGSLFRSASLAAGIPAGLRRGCQQMYGNEVNFNVAAVDCSTPHEAEYAGAVVMPEGTPFPRSDREWRVIHDACRKVVAAFVGVRPSAVRLLSQSMRSVAAWPARRDVRCYAYFGTKTMTKSAKGTNGKGVPW
jgi:hypothetical protein